MQRYIFLRFFVCSLFLGILVGNSACGVPSNANTSECTYEGKTHQGGTTFPSSDACNTCTCISAKVACTLRDCNPNQPKDCTANPAVCGADSFCLFPEGLCKAGAMPLFCQKKPQACTGDATPVCGCDEKTYSNACAAHTAGISIKAKGACPTPPKGCAYEGKDYKDGESFPDKDGCNTCSCSDAKIACTQKACVQTCGSRGLPACPTGSYCKFDATCGATDKGGTCEPSPRGCTDHIEPMCGCDDKTYNNPCEAAAVGVSVKYEGACKILPKSCVYEGKEYKDGESFPDKDGCNQCFCKNGNVACTDKACAQTCGSRGLPACPTGSYCKFDTTCGATDKGGTCEPIPQACSREIDLVCGCDNKTYNNPCNAASSSVSVKYKGACQTASKCQADIDCVKGEICVKEVCQAAAACLHNGTKQPHGASFPAGDGCNTCSCNNGAVTCTTLSCGTKCNGNADCAIRTQICINGFCKTPLTCQYNGAEYAHGASFPAGDGCNTCSCNNGAVGCSKIGCIKPCTAHKDCSSTEYCALALGVCTGQGQCKAKPQSCTNLLDPVCSCDGKTYSNSCFAESSGVNVRTKGNCVTP